MKAMMMALLVAFAAPSVADDLRLRWAVIDLLEREGVINNADVRASMNAVKEEIIKLEAETRAEICGSKRAYYEADPAGFVAVLQKANEKALAIKQAELAKLDAKLEQSGKKAEIDRTVAKISAQTHDLATPRFDGMRNGTVSHLPQLNDMCSGGVQ